jgi:hypothetical protein
VLHCGLQPRGVPHLPPEARRQGPVTRRPALKLAPLTREEQSHIIERFAVMILEMVRRRGLLEDEPRSMRASVQAEASRRR